MNKTSKQKANNAPERRRGLTRQKHSSTLQRRAGGQQSSSNAQAPADPLKRDRDDAYQPRNPTKQPQPLQLIDCPKEWPAVQRCLTGIAALDVQDSHIAASSKLDKRDKEACQGIAKAIGILMDARRFNAACTLMLMCTQSARRGLLCSNHIDTLKASVKASDEGGAKDRLLSAEARGALRRPDLPKFFQLLPSCSPKARMKLVEMFPPLTMDMVEALKDDTLVEAVRTTLERISKQDTPECLREMGSLLQIAQRLAFEPRALAMQCIIWPALRAVAARVGSSPGDLELTRLDEMARLPDADLILRLLGDMPASLRREVLRVAVDQAANPLVIQGGMGCMPEVAIEGLRDDSPNRDAAYRPLLKAVHLELAEVGILAQASSFEITKIGQKDAELAAKQASVAREMVTVLVMTGEPYYVEAAKTILSAACAEPEHQRAVIQKLIEGLRHGILVDTLESNMVHALPTLCSADASFELDVILAMNEGQKLVAEAVVKLLRHHQPDAATVASLFKALAHRVDLRAAMPAVQTVAVRSSETGPIDRIEPGGLGTGVMKTMSARMKRVQLGAQLADCTRLLRQWAPGWRLLLFMNLEPGLVHDPLWLFAAKAVDAAAGDPVCGGAEELLNQFHSGVSMQILGKMMDVLVPGTTEPLPLLSDEAVRNVMRAVVSDEDLGVAAFDLISTRSTMPTRVKLGIAMAHALIEILDDGSTCRFNPELAADHAAVAVAKALVTDSGLADEIQKGVGEEAWATIVSKAKADS